ncbi:uncharacterized protein EI97DRAFT_488293 [Westerdykella ornata]|uniref:Uncharacterized protein n=1 Tax=Westerdykella ornata TaxID=318751 RepID=A0A6A6JPL6_WESOR|nr:uncharacterized protein EI97DRAFT_488293 [Westerdykella ornata]KAF2278083.1 hypothetical protein EI97DRAFT_488293 [Westerdykella ornata]
MSMLKSGSQRCVRYAPQHGFCSGLLSPGRRGRATHSMSNWDPLDITFTVRSGHRLYMKDSNIEPSESCRLQEDEVSSIGPQNRGVCYHFAPLSPNASLHGFCEPKVTAYPSGDRELPTNAAVRKPQTWRSADPGSDSHINVRLDLVSTIIYPSRTPVVLLGDEVERE